ncbi:uncharacterized protein [Montipora foliosa]|uniref:uncharacterized protein n=1 Tax=Montipora foliosa TaxID=591990 RepID=UPI0035F1F2C1
MVMAEKKKGKPSRFRLPKSASEEQVLGDEAVPSSTKYKNKWALKLFREWQQQREMKVPILDPGGLFKDYELYKVTPVSCEIEDMDAISLIYWLTKFVREVAKDSGERYPPRTVYGIVCGVKRHLGDKNGDEALNPLDAHDKRSSWQITCPKYLKQQRENSR